MKDKLSIIGVTLFGLAAAVGVSKVIPSHNITRHIERAPILRPVDENSVDIFIGIYSGDIKQTAKKYKIPPELIAATLKSENVGRPLYGDIEDIVGTFFGYDTTLGAGQVKISTAQELDKELFGRPVLRREEIIRSLRNPSCNIEYMGKLYASEMKAMSIKDPDALLLQPESFVELASRYVGGRSHSSRLAANAGLNTLSYLIDESTFRPFGRSYDKISEIIAATKRYMCSKASSNNLRILRALGEC